MLDTNIDKQIADVDQMLSRELEQIDTKAMEDLFKGVLSDGQGPVSSPLTGEAYTETQTYS